MKPYSVDLRERVLAALDRGQSRSQEVSTFQVSLATLKRWLAARRNPSTWERFKDTIRYAWDKTRGQG